MFLCALEQKTLGIPFRTITWKRKMPGILYSGTKIEANSRNSILNHSAEEKNARNSVPCNKNRSKLSEFHSEPIRGRENNSELHSVEQKQKQTHRFVRYLDFILKTNFFCVFPFHSVSSFGINSSADLGMSTFFRGITETVSSLFCGIFFERNSVSNPWGKSKMFL
jgi:hypothetical protein